MSQAVANASLTSRLGRVTDALVSKVKHMHSIVLGETILQADLFLSLDACSEALLDLEAFLAPGFVTPASGISYTPPECAALAKLTAQMMASTLPMLAESLLAALDHDEVNSSEANSQLQATSPMVATTLCVRVCTILSRVFVTMLFTFKHLEPGRLAAEFLALLHAANFLTDCWDAFHLCTDNLKTVFPTSPVFLPDQADQFRVYLCAALLGSTLVWYSEVASTAAALSRENSEKTAKKRKGSAEGSGWERKPLWTQLQLPACDIALHQVTWLLYRIVQDCTFYQCQSLLHQTILFPSLGLEHLVREMET